MSDTVSEVLGGSLQLAVEGARRWWRDSGQKQVEEMFGEEVSQHKTVESVAVMAFLCGRLEVDKMAAWHRVQAAIRQGRLQGQIVVPGQDLSERVT